MGLTIESGGQKAYFSSQRDEREGKNIFSFKLYESVRPDPVAYLKGKVTDKETGKMLTAEYELINLSTGKTAVASSTDGNGNFLVCLPSGFNYGLNVSRKGYLFYSENFMFEIGGYTDATVTDEHNLSLSEKRALSVVDFLVSNGVPSESLQHKGF